MRYPLRDRVIGSRRKTRHRAELERQIAESRIQLKKMAALIPGNK